MSSLSLLSLPNLSLLGTTTNTTSPSSSPLFILHHPRCSLYGNFNFSTTATTAPRDFVSWQYKATERSVFAPMKNSGDGYYSKVCSFSRFRGDTGGDVDKGSGEIKAEADDDESGSGSEEEEEEEGGEEEIGHLSPNSVIPERWDVLGLGQAMVISSIPCNLFLNSVLESLGERSRDENDNVDVWQDKKG